ncbi:MAG: hypothetical protein ABSC36_00530 [Gaiellaceae bacterium]|jgi:hypothetical protein
MTPPRLAIVLELERPGAGVWLSSFDLSDELRLIDQLDARGIDRLVHDVVDALETGLAVMRKRAAKAVPADVYRRRS